MTDGPLIHFPDSLSTSIYLSDPAAACLHSAIVESQNSPLGRTRRHSCCQREENLPLATARNSAVSPSLSLHPSKVVAVRRPVFFFTRLAPRTLPRSTSSLFPNPNAAYRRGLAVGWDEHFFHETASNSCSIKLIHFHDGIQHPEVSFQRPQCSCPSPSFLPFRSFPPSPDARADC